MKRTTYKVWTAVGFDSRTLGYVKASSEKQARQIAVLRYGVMFAYVTK